MQIYASVCYHVLVCVCCSACNDVCVSLCVCVCVCVCVLRITVVGVHVPYKRIENKTASPQAVKLKKKNLSP